jgi:hypothetical protein
MARERIDFDAQEIKRIETMSGLGLTVDQMAAVLGVSKKTFERRIEDTPAAKDALEKGRALAAFNVTETAYKLAISGKVPAMTMFWLKCRARWREVNVVEHSGPDGGPIESKNLTELTDEQVDQRLKEYTLKALPKPEGES